MFQTYNVSYLELVIMSKLVGDQMFHIINCYNQKYHNMQTNLKTESHANSFEKLLALYDGHHEEIMDSLKLPKINNSNRNI